MVHINLFKLTSNKRAMKYQAKFGIDGAVSPGFGLKYSDYWETTKKYLQTQIMKQ